jgi:hypothetical protein
MQHTSFFSWSPFFSMVRRSNKSRPSTSWRSVDVRSLISFSTICSCCTQDLTSCSSVSHSMTIVEELLGLTFSMLRNAVCLACKSRTLFSFCVIARFPSVTVVFMSNIFLRSLSGERTIRFWVVWIFSCSRFISPPAVSYSGVIVSEPQLAVM